MAEVSQTAPDRPAGEQQWPDLVRQLYRSALRHRTPISGSVALTHRCNLRCIHCYLQHHREQPELPTAQWLDIIDQLQQAGCLWLVLSGGEPLLREDFAQIYRHAKDRGLLVTVFTNGTLVDEATVALFAERPPLVVEISLYGYSPQIYQEVTGDGRARATAFDAVERLARAAIPVRLKAMVVRQNAHELGLLQQYSDSRGLSFRCDTMITPCLDGSPEPCATRLDEQRIIDLDLADAKRLSAWSDCLEEEQRLVRRSLYDCGAGVTSFHLDPNGWLSPCVSDLPLYDLKQGRFLDGWDGIVRQRRDTPLPEDHPCMDCRDQAFCGVCPPVARMETGSELGVPDQLCQLGKQRRLAVQSHLAAAVGRRGS